MDFLFAISVSAFFSVFAELKRRLAPRYATLTALFVQYAFGTLNK
jgi:hypothetical protein